MTQPSQPSTPGFWDTFLFGVRKIASNGLELLTQRQTLNFIGAQVVDNPVTKAIDVTVNGGSTWQTDYDQDFTSLASIAASGNGSFVPGDGKTWTVSNFANAAQVGVVNGSGLILKCNANNTDWDPSGPTDTAPRIYVPVASLVPNFDPSWALRITAQVAVTATANYEAAAMAYGLPTGFNHAWFLVKGQRAGTNNVQFGSNGAGSTQSFFTDTSHFTDDVMQIQLTSALDVQARMLTGLYSGGWPSTAMRGRGVFRMGTGAHYEPSISVATDPCVFFLVKSTDTAAVAQLTLKRLRIEHGAWA